MYLLKVNIFKISHIASDQEIFCPGKFVNKYTKTYVILVCYAHMDLRSYHLVICTCVYSHVYKLLIVILYTNT